MIRSINSKSNWVLLRRALASIPGQVVFAASLFCVLLLCSAVTTAAAATAISCHKHSLQISDKVKHRPRKLVIAHRGASYHLPEHTQAAYRTALSLGADWIEPDIVASADGDLWVMHTVDLTVTTNVVDVFASQKKPWFSPTVNRTGYWTFNFTSAELNQLTVKQRLPEARTQMYDGLWKIPRLEDVLGLLNDWNERDLPQTLLLEDDDDNDNDDNRKNSSQTPSPRERATRLQLHQAGLYVELKDANWLLKEADINLVDLLYDHFEKHKDLWRPLLQDQCFTLPRFDEYVVPGLVLQSFDLEALQDFHERWPNKFRKELTNDEAAALGHADSTSSISPTDARPLAPEPPYVLLVNHHGCTGLPGEEFWVRMGESWSSMLSGVGCDKKCLFDNPNFARKAAEFKLVIHPWTERPEQSFISSAKDHKFATALDETRFLLCESDRVEGIFSESVATAVLAARLGCDASPFSPSTPAPVSPSHDRSKSNAELCYDDSTEASLYTGLASFVMGVFLASFISFWFHRKRRRNYEDGSAVPSGEDFADELELT